MDAPTTGDHLGRRELRRDGPRRNSRTLDPATSRARGQTEAGRGPETYLPALRGRGPGRVRAGGMAPGHAPATVPGPGRTGSHRGPRLYRDRQIDW